jgi:hypothetical protein
LLPIGDKRFGHNSIATKVRSFIAGQAQELILQALATAFDDEDFAECLHVGAPDPAALLHLCSRVRQADFLALGGELHPAATGAESDACRGC